MCEDILLLSIERVKGNCDFTVWTNFFAIVLDFGIYQLIKKTSQ